MLQALQWSQYEDIDAYVLSFTAWEGPMFHFAVVANAHVYAAWLHT